MYPIIKINTGLFATFILAFFTLPIHAGFEDQTKAWCGEDRLGGSSTAAFGDYNDDGFVDLATDTKGWLNVGGKKFEPGIGGPIIWGDINNDGHLDYAVVHGPGGHYLGDGKGGFTMAMRPPGPFGAECLAASWGDFNNDGLIDIYYGGGSGHADTMWRQVRVLPIVARYAYKGGTFRQHDEAALTFWTAHTKGKGIRFIFDERRRDNTYIYIHDRARDMTIRLPLTNGMSAYSMDDEKTWHNLYQIHVLPGRSAVPERDEERWMLVASRPGGYCRSVVACDFDEDHDADFYVSNYWLAANFLIVSGDNNKVANRAAAFNVAAGSGHSIGACWGDIDNDGYMDLFAGNFAHDGQPQSRFLRNRGKAAGYKFEDIGTRGVAFQESYASPTLGDYDNDGDLDLFFTTVYDHNAPRLYRNDSSPETGWKFTNVTSEEGIPRLPSTYQAAWGDVNNDGFLDLVTAGRLFINQGNENHWLKIRLKGNGKKVNSSAIGAKVRIKLGEKTLTRQVEGGGVGQGNQNDLTLHFGLGTHSREVDYTVTWTNGETQTGTTGIDRMIRVTMGETE